jgi:ribonuclease P protein component
MKHTHPKIEKLKSKMIIEQLFSEGNSVKVFPLRLIYMEAVFDKDIQLKIGVSVSKNLFKKATERNRIKRLLREAYRLNKSLLFNNITTQYAFMILYIGSEIPDYKTLDIKMKLLFERFLTRVSEE